MTHEELLTLCHFYHGENCCPIEYDGKIEGKLWLTERNLCEHMLLDYQLQRGETPRKAFDGYVEAMIGKWCPYDYEETMALYFDVVNDRISTQPPLITPNHIRYLTHNEIFVFGSNLQGAHAGGAAHIAHEKFGAEWGKGVGRTGQCYAIPTMQGGVGTIRPYVDDFIRYAVQHPKLIFLVTRIGCGIAGFTDLQIAPLFSAAVNLPNVALPVQWRKLLYESNRKELQERYVRNCRYYNGEDEYDFETMGQGNFFFWEAEEKYVRDAGTPEEQETIKFYQAHDFSDILTNLPLALMATLFGMCHHVCQKGSWDGVSPEDVEGNFRKKFFPEYIRGGILRKG